VVNAEGCSAAPAVKRIAPALLSGRMGMRHDELFHRRGLETRMAIGRAERRLAAILAADVAGYSRLMGADEGGTLERLKALRPDPIDPKIACTLFCRRLVELLVIMAS
jgi:class 3 adenylate cyclase